MLTFSDATTAAGAAADLTTVSSTMSGMVFLVVHRLGVKFILHKLLLLLGGL